MPRRLSSLPAFAAGVALISSGLVAMAPSASSSSWPIVSGGYTLEDIAYEGFNYPSGNLNNRNGGLGWANAWTPDNEPFETGVSGLTYTGLPTEAGAIRATATGGVNSDSTRTLDDSVDSGVVYFQFLSIFERNHGGGTPNIRLEYQGSSTGAIGNNGFTPNNMALMNSALSPLAVSAAPLTQLNLTVLRIDYDQVKTSLWINPNLATFDYASPPPDDTSAVGFAPKIDRIYPISRYGGDTEKDKFDEIRIMRLVAPPAPDPAPPVPPLAPGTPTGTPGDRSVNLSWEAPASTGSFPITHYEAVAKPSGGMCLATTTSCRISGLTNGMAYTFEVRALTGAGWGPWSLPSAAVTPAAPPRPSILIKGSRVSTDGRPGVLVTGTVANVGSELLLRPWVRLAGARDFSQGRAEITVPVAGDFTWHRRASKGLSVYMQATSQTIRSNTVTIR
jgi:hypothetical protein